MAETVKLSALVSRTAEESYVSLDELVQKCRDTELSDSEKKISMLKYIVKTQQRMLRLNVLANWCQQVHFFYQTCLLVFLYLFAFIVYVQLGFLILRGFWAPHSAGINRINLLVFLYLLPLIVYVQVSYNTMRMLKWGSQFPYEGHHAPISHSYRAGCPIGMG